MATKTITSTEELDAELNTKMPVVVDFWADWCAPCKALAPILEGLSDKFEGSVKVLKVNIMEHQELTKKYKITSVPYLAVFKGGKLSSGKAGFGGAEALEKMFEDLSK